MQGTRRLIRPLRQPVKTFQPYDSVKEPNPEARKAARALIAEALAGAPERKTMIYVNNRLEGSALETIAAMLAPAAP